MKYKLTKAHKEWLQELILVTQPKQRKIDVQNWIDNGSTATDARLASLDALYSDNTTLQPQVTSFVSWVKGGDRPPRPHG